MSITAPRKLTLCGSNKGTTLCYLRVLAKGKLLPIPLFLGRFGNLSLRCLTWMRGFPTFLCKLLLLDVLGFHGLFSIKPWFPRSVRWRLGLLHTHLLGLITWMFGPWWTLHLGRGFPGNPVGALSYLFFVLFFLFRCFLLCVFYPSWDCFYTSQWSKN